MVQSGIEDFTYQDGKEWHSPKDPYRDPEHPTRPTLAFDPEHHHAKNNGFLAYETTTRQMHECTNCQHAYGCVYI